MAPKKKEETTHVLEKRLWRTGGLTGSIGYRVNMILAVRVRVTG